ncbi:MAG: hypothetical protein OHK006_22200 [Thermodesulfovibrionales bacterium]
MLAGCVGTPSAVPTLQQPQNHAGRGKTEALNASLMSAAVARPGEVDEGYRIGAEDLLEIEAYNVEEIKKTVRVNSEGNIALPLVGILNVKGLTTNEAEALIAKRLEKYIEETVVTVFVREFKSNRISVVGAVKNPQIFFLTGQRSLVDLLMMAGGLTPEAGQSCFIIRPLAGANSGSRAQTIVIDLEDLLANGNFSLNIPVFSGDIINIPRGGVFFVDGAVRTPGAFTMKGRMTVVQAIAMSQGVTDVAMLDDIRIFRENERKERDIIPVDYDAIRKGEKPDIPIQDNDVIIVPVSGVKSFFNSFIRTLQGSVTIGGVGLSGGL